MMNEKEQDERELDKSKVESRLKRENRRSNIRGNGEMTRNDGCGVKAKNLVI